MQIFSGHFPAPNPLGVSCYSKDQVQTSTSDLPLPRLFLVWSPTHAESLDSTSPTARRHTAHLLGSYTPRGVASTFPLQECFPPLHTSLHTYGPQVSHFHFQWKLTWFSQTRLGSLLPSCTLKLLSPVLSCMIIAQYPFCHRNVSTLTVFGSPLCPQLLTQLLFGSTASTQMLTMFNKTLLSGCKWINVN